MYSDSSGKIESVSILSEVKEQPKKFDFTKDRHIINKKAQFSSAAPVMIKSKVIVPI